MPNKKIILQLSFVLFLVSTYPLQAQGEEPLSQQNKTREQRPPTPQWQQEEEWVEFPYTIETRPHFGGFITPFVQIVQVEGNMASRQEQNLFIFGGGIDIGVLQIRRFSLSPLGLHKPHKSF